MDLKGTKTEANLQTAFAGESMATNKYAYYASKAKKTKSSDFLLFAWLVLAFPYFCAIKIV